MEIAPALRGQGRAGRAGAVAGQQIDQLGERRARLHVEVLFVGGAFPFAPGDFGRVRGQRRAAREDEVVEAGRGADQGHFEVLGAEFQSGEVGAASSSAPKDPFELLRT